MSSPAAPEQGIESFTLSGPQLMELIGAGNFQCALHVAALFLCVAHGFLRPRPIES